MTPEETRERLLYRDGLMLVFDKPAGVAVHAGPKGGASLEDDFDALRFGLPRKPALAHRLDRDTAGCLVLGRHHKALEKLGLLFKQGKIAKTYWAIVAGAPEGEEGTIDLPLGRLDDKIGWWMKVDPNGQKSLTLWRVKGRGTWRGAPIAWLELEPKTGRTHQLRVHCASQGWPIFGDAIYGARADLPLQLLARKVDRAAFEVEAADRGRSARAAPHAGGACGVRLRGRSAGGLVGGRTARRDQAAAARDCAAQQIVKGSSSRHQPPEAMSIRAAIHHLTHYKYDRPVSLGPQIIRLRPAPHSRTRVISHSLKVSPANHFVNHQQDPYGNWLARYVFPELVNELKIEVDVVADMTVYNPFDFFVEESAETWPFEYPEDLRPDLVIYRTPEHAGPRLQAFLSGIDRTPRRTVDFVVDLNRRLAGEIQYLIRMESGVQTPEETFERGSGSCRDSSWLLVQIFRHLGLAARFVSGYLIQLKPDLVALDGPPGTDHDFTDLHAWAEVYLPGAGWIGLDPTSGLLAGGKPHSAGRNAALSQRRADFRPRELRQCRFQFRHAGRSGLRTSAHHQAVF